MKIGLEIHVQLATKTKLFCSCPNKIAKKPNTITCDYCLGLPGTKPQLNKKAVDYAIKIGLALNCTFPEKTYFSRKSYFYPDMSKNFQITQYEIPFAKNGYVSVNIHNKEKKIRIRRIQLEEDPARIVHIGGSITEAKYVLVDYNRSGIPLCEIVTEPDMENPAEARLFLQKLSSILQYLNVFNPDVEGSIRVDANISLGSSRVEIKNISGFKEVEKALNFEFVRQRNLIKKSKEVLRETRGWDAVAKVTRSLRSKEGEEEYGYIFEPDLPYITLPKDKIKKIKDNLPELAEDKIKKYVKWGIKKDIAIAISSEPDLAECFEEVVKNVDKHLAARWFAGEIKKTLNYNNLALKKTNVRSKHISRLLEYIEKGRITERTAEMVFREMILSNNPIEVMEKNIVTRISDEAALSKLAEKVIQKHPKAVLDFKSGKSEVFNFLVGQIMRETKGRGDPETIRKVLKKILG